MVLGRDGSVERQSGFTLLEIMVVVVIVGIVVSMATLSMGVGQGRDLEQHAQRLKALIDLAAEEAILRGQELAVEVKGNGYSFIILEEDKWNYLKDDDTLRPRKLPEHLSLKIALDGATFELAAPEEKTETSEGGEQEVAEVDPEKLKAEGDGKAKQGPQPDPEAPRIFLLSSGEMTPFSITLSQIDGSRFEITGSLTGNVKVQALKNAEQDL